MIKVSYKCDSGNIIEFEVKGHADSIKVNGFDGICAIVSTLLVGGFNSIEDDSNYQMTLKEGYAFIKVKEPNDKDNARIETILNQLKMLETKYSKNISVKEK